ncbi:MAG: polynucleotide kinase-phosphatase [Gracilibacteraceae bacterium]|jgi:protein phosphatase|nr:polynucleotide kinase-phosphatase [Gracilibacteraceae bacterium]
MRIEIPELSVVVLAGVSGSGKSTFAKARFKPTEVLSSDYFRALVSDDENNQQATPQAFDALYYVAGKRLEAGLLTVIDATNVQKEDRAGAMKLAKARNCHAVAIVLDIPEEVCRERNASRSDRNIGDHVVKRQGEQLRRSIRSLKKEGFRYIYVLKSEEEAAQAEIIRMPLWNNKKGEHGPFDVIGDVHGCYDELCALLSELGYDVDKEHCAAVPPVGRRAVFLGDLCDRGPGNVDVLRLVMNMKQAGAAFCVAGNHDVKLLKKLRGHDVRMSHGLDKTVEQLAAQSDECIAEVKAFLDGLISHYVFDDGRLVAAHAGLIETYQGRASGRVREFCLYGDTDGETDEYGLPVRLPWANEYRGKALVVYGHTPAPEAEFVNNTICIDTGCVFGGGLTAYRYPEKTLVRVPANREYYAPVRPFLDEPVQADDMLNIDDVTGRKYLSTRLRRSVKIGAENAAAALEVMSRFAADPRWLIYLPPTMSPCETSGLADYLEYPADAFDYFKARGVSKLVCEQKHMGSRAVIVLCRDAETASRRFKVNDGGFGIIYTRTGRRFFDDEETEKALLARLRAVLDKSCFWEDFSTGWLCLDAEIMPWNAKAQKLLEEQYAPVGAAGRGGLDAAMRAVRQAIAASDAGGQTREAQSDNDADLPALLAACEERADALSRYTGAYRQYCWNVEVLDDYRAAPFHMLATEGKVWCEQDHIWHMETIEKYMTGFDRIFLTTNYLPVDLSDEGSVAAGIAWWMELTANGGEGMVVKPRDFIPTKGGELLQPAVKCRGREYLRIIYGPEYTLGENLERLKKRSLSKKRNLALNEFALGMESLERFVRNEPLYRVHECVFGVLAMESEPVDPRL